MTTLLSSPTLLVVAIAIAATIAASTSTAFTPTAVSLCVAQWVVKCPVNAIIIGCSEDNIIENNDKKQQKRKEITNKSKLRKKTKRTTRTHIQTRIVYVFTKQASRSKRKKRDMLRVLHYEATSNQTSRIIERINVPQSVLLSRLRTNLVKPRDRKKTGRMAPDWNGTT